MFGVAGLQPRQTATRGATCQAARDTLDATDTAILGAPIPTPTAAGKPWDRKLDPVRWSRIAQRFGLDDRHRASLVRDGFVVPETVGFWNYVEAFHEIFQSELPVYVSIDSIMHAIYASHAGVVGDVEDKVLTPQVVQLLSAMHCGMAAHAGSWPRDVAKDVDLYLTVARTLLTDKPVASVLGNDAVVKDMIKRIDDAKGLDQIELFGRSRIVDFGAFKPRGRYAYGGMRGYFRAMTWLSRIELNLVSRGSRSSTMRIDPSETPREVAVALALIELARDTDVLDDISTVDTAWGELAGKREDVSFAILDTLRDRAHVHVDLGAQPAIARMIGTSFRRSMPTQVTPDGVTDLPVITAMFGARVNPDTSALAPIIQPKVPQRIEVSASDIGFVLGHDRAKKYLAADLARFPTLDRQLGVARATLDSRLGGDDLYSGWLRAIRAIAKTPTGIVPSFMKSDAYADLKLNSVISAFGQLRTSYELMSGMAYLGSGCEIPDGYVEPAAEVYDALIAYADRGKIALARIDPDDKSHAALYFTRLGTTLRVLRAIVATELAGRPLSDTQKKWLSMVVEIIVDNSGSGAPPTYAGWYFDLFRSFNDATAQPGFITGFAQNAETVFYAGAKAPRLGVFVVDTGGVPRVVTGPVANTYETAYPGAAGRLTDPTVGDGQASQPVLSAPWATYTLGSAEKTAPPVDVEEEWDPDDKSPATVPRKTWLSATASQPTTVTIQLLDHHRVPLASMTREVGTTKTFFKFAQRVDKVEMLHLQVGKFHAWSERRGDNGFGFWLRPRKRNNDGNVSE